MSLPSKEQAEQFALMLHSGLPAEEAIVYFSETEDPQEIALILRDWMKSRAVRTASAALQRKPWVHMTLDEKIHHSLDLHYAGLAYFLQSHNYSSLTKDDKAKADTARQALEAKVAGTAGKLDALSQFADDIRTGRLKLRAGPSAPSLPASES